MIDLDSELAGDYLAESRDHLANLETDLLALEEGGARMDQERMNRMFQAIRSVQGGAGVLELLKIGKLAHQTENALTLIRSGEIVSTPDRVRVLLRATDRMRELIQNPGASNQADIAELMTALEGLSEDRPPSARTSGPASRQTPSETEGGGARLRTLLVEDDFASRLVLQTFLARYGECHVAVNGREAVDAFRSVLEQGRRYDLICMDIMMPELDGRAAVRQIRALEEEHGILSTYGAKIIMTTAVDDVKEVSHCFHELCDAYLMKPIDLTLLLNQIRSFHLIT